MINQFARAMKSESLSDTVIRTFSAYYKALQEGDLGEIPESSIRPPGQESVLQYSELGTSEESRMLKKIAVIKLNGVWEPVWACPGPNPCYP